VLEKLRQRQAEQHRRTEDEREVKRLDEVASQRAFRRLQEAAEEAGP
jgi:flagellar biosynthesis chaperone FliJ